MNGDENLPTEAQRHRVDKEKTKSTPLFSPICVSVPLWLVILLLCRIATTQAEIVLEQNTGTLQHTEAQGLPTIVYSTTLSTPEPNAVVQSFVLSIFPDGSANVLQTLDNQRNRSLPAGSRKISIQTFGPKILPEKAQAELQKCFSVGTPWNIPEKAFAVRDPGEKGFWMAELSLQSKASLRHCALSSSEKKNPEIEKKAYEFLFFLERVRSFVCGNGG